MRLEPLSEAHLDGLAEVAFAPSIWKYMMQTMRTVDDLRGWIATARRLEGEGTCLPWATMLAGRVVGATRLMDVDWHHRTAEIGKTWLAPEVQGTGVNTEAKLLQLGFAFEELGMRRVCFKTHHENLRSQAAIRALGAVGEGTFRNHYIMPDGSQRHSVWFAITREEWPGVRSRLEQRVAGWPQRSA